MLLPRFSFLTLAVLLTASPALAERITVFAAASLSGALGQIAKDFERETGHEVVLSLAGTSALARQISQGAPADIFISANPDWMDRVASDGRIAESTRFDLASNRLVLVGTGAAGAEFPAQDLPDHLGDGRLAMALVDAVPAGIYGKAALEAAGLWSELEAKVAQTDNVRAALALVAVGAAPFGVVYASDAKAEPRVHVALTFPEDSHPPIRYPAAAVQGQDRDAVLSFLAYLKSAEARDALRVNGFQPVER